MANSYFQNGHNDKQESLFTLKIIYGWCHNKLGLDTSSCVYKSGLYTEVGVLWSRAVSLIHFTCIPVHVAKLLKISIDYDICIKFSVLVQSIQPKFWMGHLEN